MKDYLHQLTAYNSWANSRILTLAAAAGEERSLIIQNSSFPSIKQTVLHTLDAQTIWMSRLNGISPKEWPEQKFNGTTVAACGLLVESSGNYQAFVASLTTADLESVINYHNLKGMEFRNTVFQIVVHVMNHSTFHRGQLITMFRGAGFEDLSSTDMITFFREVPG